MSPGFPDIYFLVVKSVSRFEEPLFSLRLQVQESDILSALFHSIGRHGHTLSSLSAGACAGGQLVLGDGLVASCTEY
jgi:hypothetical protein